MKVSDDIIYSLFPKGNIGGSRHDHWVTDCPFCDKPRHFYIRIKEYNEKMIGLFDCKKCSTQGNIDILLLKMNKRDILDDLKSYDLSKLESLIQKPEIIQSSFELKETKEVSMPIGYKRLYTNTYLEVDRKFTKQDFLKYEVGSTSLLRKFQDYIILPVVEFGKKVGYVGRNTLKDERLRYINSEGFQKSSLFYGLNERHMFSTALIVEGFFDKKSADSLIEEYDFSFKCLSTFGKSIGDDHISKLKYMGVDTVIIAYDPDAIREIKNTLSTLINQFSSVLVCDISNGKDIDASSKEDIYKYLTTLRRPQEYYTNKLSFLRN